MSCVTRVPVGFLSSGLPSTGGGDGSSCWQEILGECCATTELNIEVSTTSWAGAGVMPLMKIAAIVAVGVSKEKTRFMGLLTEFNNPIKQVA